MVISCRVLGVGSLGAIDSICMLVSMPELSFPMTAPGPGATIEVSRGVHWLSTPLPFRPHATNLWLFRDLNGWTMIDCGFPSPVVREQIEAAWSKTLGNLPITRLIVTHHHLDHVGNCRWICDRWGIVPTITEGEQTLARAMTEGRRERRSDRMALYLRHGLPESVATEFTRHWQRYDELFSALPDRWERLDDGGMIRIGRCDWRVIVARGHSPEQVLLYSPQQRVLISGDQVLPKTTSNVSLLEDSPSANPVALFLESNERLALICDKNVLVLPSHNVPFFGLHARIKVLAQLRRERLAKLEHELQLAPQAAADLIPSLFGDLYNDEIGFALGEVIAQLDCLVQQGRAKRISSDGKVVFCFQLRNVT